jgi:hypothetical protein
MKMLGFLAGLLIAMPAWAGDFTFEFLPQSVKDFRTGAVVATPVRRQMIWDSWRYLLAEHRPHPGLEFKRRVCCAASVDAGWSGA